MSKAVGSVVFLALTSVVISTASAQSTANEKSKAAQFLSTEMVLQQESTSMPSSSPPVDRAAGAADPIPRATTPAQKKARFAAEERTMQRDSTSMPSSSPRVDRSTAAADPIPRATTPAQKKARFAAEEKAMQQESTR